MNKGVSSGSSIIYSGGGGGGGNVGFVRTDEYGRQVYYVITEQDRALRAAWEAARAAAAKVAADYCWVRSTEGGILSSPAVFTTHTWQDIRDAILAITPPEFATRDDSNGNHTFHGGGGAGGSGIFNDPTLTTKGIIENE